MQLRDIVCHPYLKREEELLGVIYKLRMAAAEQVADVMGISKKYVQMLKSDLNKEGEMILTHYQRRRGARRLPFSKEYTLGPRMYALGPAAKSTIEAIVGHPIYFKKHTGKQQVHYYGLNDILVRTLKQVIEDESRDDELEARVTAWERLQWLNTQETAIVIEQAWAPLLEKDTAKEQKETRKDLIHPDARLLIDGRPFWIEYDDGSERLRSPEEEPDYSLTTIEDKMGRYLFSLTPIQNKDPVVWVTPSPIRRDNMRDLWEEICCSQPHEDVPNMYFFTPGEEQSILLDSQSELSVTY